MSREVDDLAQLLKQSEASQTTFEHNMTYHRSTAKDLLAVGYRKPREITTTEELDALPQQSAILCGPIPYSKSGPEWYIAGSGHVWESSWIIGHAQDNGHSITVLSEPQP